MHERELGRSGLRVSAIGLGCWGMSGSYGEVDETEAEATLRRAIELGVTLIDTADSYGEDGHNETLVGRTLEPFRSRIVLASKTGFVRTRGADGRSVTSVDARPDRIRSACEGSLKRLRTDVIDLYYLHRADPNVPIEDSVGAMADLVKQGKVRHLGLSEVAPETLRRGHATHPIAALQAEYSLWTREPETTVLPVCRELGIGFVPFSPLGRGFLTGTITQTSEFSSADWRATNPRFSGSHFDRNRQMLSPLQSLAQAKNATPGQVALVWLLAQEGPLVPIPGTKRRRYLEENVEAVNVSLDKADLAMLDAAFPPGAASGERYHPDYASFQGR